MKTNWKTVIAALATFATLTPMSAALAAETYYDIYYNASSGAAAVGDFGNFDDANNFTQIKGYLPGFFSTGWTQIVNTLRGTLQGIFFYNASNGAAAVGNFEDAGNFAQIKGYPPGAFSTGWTSIVDKYLGSLR